MPSAREGLFGEVAVPPSKSLAQRYVLAACLAGPPSQVENVPGAEDPQLFLAALQRVGFKLRVEGARVRVEGYEQVAGAELFLGNNGTGARLILALVASLPGRYVVDGALRLRERPLGGLVAALRSLGARISGESLPVMVEGGELERGAVRVDARLSSQFVSALLFLGCRMPAGLRVEFSHPVPSWPYVEMTAGVLREFGAEVVSERGAVIVRGPLQPRSVAVEGDWSAAAFPLVGVAVAGGDLRVTGLQMPSLQGDAAIVEILRGAGCEVTSVPQGVRIVGPASGGVAAGLSDVPDLFPPLAVLVALRGGELSGLGHLAYKESDRVRVMADRLHQLGLEVMADGASFCARGGARPKAPAQSLSPEADHRIAMALAVAGLVTPGLRLSDPQCVGKSWPGFFEAWRRLVR